MSCQNIALLFEGICKDFMKIASRRIYQGDIDLLVLPVSQAVLDGIFSSRGLDRSAESDPCKKGQLAARLLRHVAYKGSQNLVFSFDFYPGEERLDPQRDDVTCLGVSHPLS